MAELRTITAAERNVLHKVDSGAIRFRLNVPLPGLGPTLTLISKDNPSAELYKIIIGRQTKVLNMTSPDQDIVSFPISNISFHEFQGFWLTWYAKKLKMGLQEQEKPFLVYKMDAEKTIGYVQFNAGSRHWAPVEWIIETSPVILKPLPYKKFDNELHWVRCSPDHNLPDNAFVGGFFENELIYVARAYHNNALCPGKYVPSTGLAYIAWGHRAHSKREYEILCGFNAKWVKTKLNYIPTNAFIGGQAETQNEPLYIGRAQCENKLITGKVHVRYKTCFLPYNGREIEKTSYEILVVPQDEIPQAIPYE